MTSENNYSIPLESSSIPQLISTICSVVKKHLHVNPNNETADSIEWRTTWQSYITGDLPKCKTARSIATIVYGAYDRNKHPLVTIMEEMFSNIPILQRYLEFVTNDVGDMTMVAKPVKFDDLLVEHHEIHPDYDIQLLNQKLSVEIDKYISNAITTPEWIQTWLYYQTQGFEQFESIKDYGDIFSEDITLESLPQLILKIRENIPILFELFSCNAE